MLLAKERRESTSSYLLYYVHKAVQGAEISLCLGRPSLSGDEQRCREDTEREYKYLNNMPGIIHSCSMCFYSLHRALSIDVQAEESGHPQRHAENTGHGECGGEDVPVLVLC